MGGSAAAWSRALALLVALASAACASSPSPRRTSTLVELPPEIGQDTCRSFSWPLSIAGVSSGFGRRDGRQHQGIDLVVPEGTPVHAACAGVVAYAGEKLRGYGRLLIVRHAAGLSTVYAHNRELLVAEGTPVQRGQLIARSGKTGRVTAPHLHFELRREGRAIDPLPFLPRLNPTSGPSASVDARLQPPAGW